jgi:D-arabinose 1-dehydrogenase-like Zn-dependent alcohol dehydrogenase
MTIEFTVYKGSESGKIVQTKSRRELGRSEAVVRITHSGVCGTDLHVQHQDIALGHEGIGIVTEIGSAVTSVKVGDRVGFGYMHYFCGNCEPCLAGTFSLSTTNYQVMMYTASIDGNTFLTIVMKDRLDRM